MTGSPPHEQPSKFTHLVMIWLYPRLRELPPAKWESMLRKARDTNFETGEWIGVIGGIALVAWIVDVEAPVFSMQAAFVSYLLQFVLALPLLAVVVGPIYLRRTRRGLDRELARKSASPGNVKSSCDRNEA